MICVRPPLLALLALLLLLGGCGPAPGGRPAAPEPSPWEEEQAPIVEWGCLTGFYYEYGSYSGGYCQFSLTPRLGGAVLFEAWGFNGVDMASSVELDPSVLSVIQQIIEDNAIAAWNGFNEADEYAHDGYGFSLLGDYDTGLTLQAQGYMAYPDNYEPGHAALSSFLLQLAAQYPYGEVGAA